MSDYDTDPYRDGRESREYDPGLADEWLPYEYTVPAEELDRRDRLNHEQAYQDLAWEYMEGDLTAEQYEAEVSRLNEYSAKHGYPTHDPYPEPEAEPPAAEVPAAQEYDPGLTYEESVPAEVIEARERTLHEQAYQDLEWGLAEGLFTSAEYEADLAQLKAWGAEQGYPVPEAYAAAAPSVTADQLGAAVEAAQGAAVTITARAPEVAPAPAPVVEAPQVALGVEPPAPF